MAAITSGKTSTLAVGVEALPAVDTRADIRLPFQRQRKLQSWPSRNARPRAFSFPHHRHQLRNNLLLALPLLPPTLLPHPRGADEGAGMDAARAWLLEVVAVAVEATSSFLPLLATITMAQNFNVAVVRVMAGLDPAISMVTGVSNKIRNQLPLRRLTPKTWATSA